MKLFILFTTLLLVGAAIVSLVPSWRCRGCELFANAITVININGPTATFLGDNQFTARYLLCKPGSDASHIDICSSSDIPLGVVPDMTPTTDGGSDLSYPLPVNFLGLCEKTERMVASGIIAVGAFVVPDNSGKVKTLPATTGTYYICGRAKTASAANNDLIEVVPCFPIINRVP